MNSVVKMLLKRIGTSLVVLIGVSMLIFTIARVIPGDPARIALGPNASIEQMDKLRERLHLNDNIITNMVILSKTFLMETLVYPYTPTAQ